MIQKELSELSDQELLEKAKAIKKSSFLSALVIGIMIGVIAYSIAANSIGFFTLIPLFFIYKIVNGSNDNEAVKKLLEQRNLK